MRLSRALNEKKLDVRLRDKLVTEGKISSSEVSSFLNGLEDEANNLVYTDDVEKQKKAEAEANAQSEEVAQ